MSSLELKAGDFHFLFDRSQGNVLRRHNFIIRNARNRRETVIKKADTGHRINQTHSRADRPANNNSNPLFCRYSPTFVNYQGAIINRLICHICIFQKFSRPFLTVACARSRSHHRSQTSDSRNIRCTFWPEIRHFRRSGELLWSVLSPP